MNPWAAAGLGFLLLLMAVTDQSIDLEEAHVWGVIREDSFGGVVARVGDLHRWELQMPFGMLVSWCWGKLFGFGEYALRSVTLLWASVALLAMASVGRRMGMGWLPLLFAVQPLVWISMDKAQLPMMLMAGGALLLAGTVTALGHRVLDVRAWVPLLAGSLILCGASLLGLAAVIAVALGLAWNRCSGGLEAPRVARSFVVVLGLIVLGLAAYTFAQGFAPLRLWKVSPANLLFVGYEFGGFQGLGPGRQELRLLIRGMEPLSLALAYLPALAVLAAAYGIVFCAGWKAWLTRPFERITGSPSALAAWTACAGACVVSFLLVLAFGLLTGFSFFARHLAPMFPFWVLLLGITLRWAGQGLWRTSGRLATCILVLLLVLSTVMVRTAPHHKHDDYRSAVAEAVRLASEGRDVWWVADSLGAEYYGLDVADPAGRVQLVTNLFDPAGDPPGAIILSRPDNFDQLGLVRKRIAASGYKPTRRLQSFQVWILGEEPNSEP